MATTFATALIATALVTTGQAEPVIIEVPPPAIFVGFAPDAPPTLPADVERLIRAAMASGDEAAVASMIRYAREAFPRGTPEIQRLGEEFDHALADRRSAAAEAARERLASARITENWEGRIELGASRTTGKVDSFGFYGAIEAERRGLSWDNMISARAEFQETNDVRSAERIVGTWRPRYRIGDDLNVYGLAQFEHDPILSLSGRYTLGGGIGYAVLDGSDLSLRLDGGPAIRRTRTTRGDDFTALGGRASIDFDWKVSPTLEIKQDGSFIMDGGNESGRAITAIEARLFGPVRARLSYELRYERNEAIGSESFDTSGRTTIVVGL